VCVPKQELGYEEESRTLNPIPRSAYIHVPFCAHRCGYCNFTLVAGRNDLVDSYLAALETELSGLGTPHEVDTLYLGGGTPTELCGSQFEQLLATVLKWHPIAAGGEFTVEANPADVDHETTGILAACGVNRVSLGAQSFNASKLRRLERNHTPVQIGDAVNCLRSAGIRNISLDLIFAAPGETAADWQADLAMALTLEPAHLSTYGLTYERGTTFWNRLHRGELAQVDEETERAQYAQAIDTLTSASFEHYEVSSFARAGMRSRHNEVYWTGNPYFAAGPGACRYLNGVRETNHRSTTAWIKRLLAGQSPVADREQLPREAAARELLVFSLRRLEGVSRSWFAAKTGYCVDQLVGPALARHVQAELLSDDGERVRLTREGLFVSDCLWPDFLADPGNEREPERTTQAPVMIVGLPNES
jgi:oxygen-independent coproporphyrinogen-3 oxidase